MPSRDLPPCDAGVLDLLHEDAELALFFAAKADYAEAQAAAVRLVQLQPTNTATLQ